MIKVSYKPLLSKVIVEEFYPDGWGKFCASEYKKELEKQFPFIEWVKMDIPVEIA